jgi:predicted SAM-dependent methyltransferase
VRGSIRAVLCRYTDWYKIKKINICSGGQKVPGYWGIDLDFRSDLIIDLAKKNLPFPAESIECVICTSGINYFTRNRALELVRETHRVLRPGGVARYSVQDLEWLTRRYLEKDWVFFGQKLPNGEDRFKGETLADKFVAWFYGYHTAGGPCRYMYDYTSLATLFMEAGFEIVEKRGYLDSRLDYIEMIDNRPEQMFFLEAVK